MTRSTRSTDSPDPGARSGKAGGTTGINASGTIRLTDVKKTYRLGSSCVQALRGVNMALDGPGFFAIMGPSGSGKSTLLHLLAALDRPDEGTLEVAGHHLETLSERELTLFRRRFIGIIFQQFNLISTLSAIDNITLPALLDGMPRPRRLELARELIDTLGLQGRAHHRPDALSGGEQQRVAIARALVFRPSILFADEPTGDLDSATSREVWELLQRLAEERKMTILMVTHEPTAAAHCERVYVLGDGRITGSFETGGIDAGQLATRAQQLGR
ncbi:MAG: ABC transporter ATP-binding protein [Phycisphaerales bacterium]|nr:MAG: ABC transporter ATP-binding protein [Phycisphaerales bacterium]